MEIICAECGKVLSFIGNYFNHLNNIHHKNYTKEQFYDLYLRKSPDEGKCLNCGEPTKFSAKNRIAFYL